MISRDAAGATAGTAGTAVAGLASTDVVAVAADGVAVLVGAAVDEAPGFVSAVRGLTRSGKSFGAIAAHSHRTAIDTPTAAKILFSISGDGVPTSWIEYVAAR